jgi:hypothetical protein
MDDQGKQKQKKEGRKKGRKKKELEGGSKPNNTHQDRSKNVR